MILKNYLFLALRGLHCCVGFSLVVASGIYSLVVVLGLLIAAASLFAEACDFSSRGSWALGHWLNSCGSQA